jgi:hypothetical protein
MTKGPSCPVAWPGSSSSISAFKHVRIIIPKPPTCLAACCLPHKTQGFRLAIRRHSANDTRAPTHCSSTHQRLPVDNSHPPLAADSRTAAASRTMLLRLRTPDGTFRITVEKEDTYGQLATQVCRQRGQDSGCRRDHGANTRVHSSSHCFLRQSTLTPSPFRVNRQAAMHRKLAPSKSTSSAGSG